LGHGAWGKGRGEGEMGRWGDEGTKRRRDEGKKRGGDREMGRLREEGKRSRGTENIASIEGD